MQQTLNAAGSDQSLETPEAEKNQKRLPTQSWRKVQTVWESVK